MVRNFMGDLRTQLVFGTFLMTIIYCLLVLRTLHSELDVSEVPHIAVTVGTVLALINLFALLFFIHILARSIISDTAIRRVERDLRNAISRLLPAEEDVQRLAEQPTVADVLPVDFDERAAVLRLSGEGYVQTIEYEQLVEIACRHKVVIRLDFRAGHFVIQKSHKAEIYPGSLLNPDLATELEGAILVGDERTPIQDLEFSMRQLVEIAVRALSAGINDPFTAIAVVDRLVDQRYVLLDHAAVIAETGRRGASEASDIADIERSYQAAQLALSGRPRPAKPSDEALGRG